MRENAYESLYSYEINNENVRESRTLVARRAPRARGLKCRNARRASRARLIPTARHSFGKNYISNTTKFLHPHTPYDQVLALKWTSKVGLCIPEMILETQQQMNENGLHQISAFLALFLLKSSYMFLIVFLRIQKVDM